MTSDVQVDNKDAAVNLQLNDPFICIFTLSMASEAE